MKKLYAFKNIQQLVKLDTPSSKTRAKELSLENNFVTDLTSLVIPSQREEEVRVANLGENTEVSGQDWASTRMSQNYSPGVQTTSLQFGSNTHSPHSNQRSYLNHHGGPRSGTLYRYSSGSGVPGQVYRAGPRLRSGMSGPPGPRPSATTSTRPTTTATTTTITTTTTTTTTTRTATEKISSNCSITLYEAEYHAGEQLLLTENVSDLSLHQFEDAVHSVKVEGECKWIMFSGKNLRQYRCKLIKKMF